MPKAKDLTAPIDLLNLVSLDLLPEMSQALEERDGLAAKLEAVEAELLQTNMSITFYRNSSAENPAMFETLIADAKAKIKALEIQQTQLRSEAVVLDEAVNLRRKQTRSEALPAIRAMALPELDAKIRTLEVIAMVNRLLIGKKSQARTARQRQNGEELRYLQQVRALLVPEEA